MRLSFTDINKHTGIYEINVESNPFKVGDKFHLFINEVVNNKHHQNSRKWYEIVNIKIYMSKHINTNTADININTADINNETIIVNSQTENSITAYIDVIEV